MERFPGHVTLYALQRPLGLHRDALALLCGEERIPVVRRWNTRFIATEYLPDLELAARIYRQRPRGLWSRRAAAGPPGSRSARTPGTISSGTTTPGAA